MSNGAPVGATALNCPSATRSRETVNSIGSTALLFIFRDCSAVNPLKMPAGNSVRALLFRLRDCSAKPLKTVSGNAVSQLLFRLRDCSAINLLKTVSGSAVSRLLFRLRDSNAVKSSKSPAFRDVILLKLRSSEIILDRWSTVISSGVPTPAAARIVSRTCGVRSLSGLMASALISTIGRSSGFTTAYPRCASGKRGKAPISAVTGSSVPGVRVTVSISLSRLP